ncbi:DUF4956 domain-containing protein [Bacillus paramycoides]|uniref:DUF4956 domain-containing protein n=1 Tax=Bacillus paramycoides TaxID=2026194 RepID=A0ABU6N1N4_9BACI|nr:DUF4956 domain-containing protein [Bacillus paramycoides]
MNNGQVKFSDIIKKSFIEQNMFGKMPIENIILGMVLSFVIGMFIFYIYKKTFRGVVYSHNFNVTLVLMVMTTTLIILTISTNVVLSLGMVGALSIVRFRTAIKDPLDVIFMFWAIAGGITVGAGVYALAIVGSLFIGLVVYGLTRQKSKDSIFLLIIHHEEKATESIKYQLAKIKHSMKSKIVRNDITELTVELKIKGDNTAFVNKLSEVEGVKDVSLINYNGDYAA